MAVGFKNERNTKKHRGIRHCEVGLKRNEDEGWFLEFDHEGQDVPMKVVLEDCMVPNVEEERSNVFVIKINVPIANEDMCKCVMCCRKRQEKDCHH